MCRPRPSAILESASPASPVWLESFPPLLPTLSPLLLCVLCVLRGQNIFLNQFQRPQIVQMDDPQDALRSIYNDHGGNLALFHAVERLAGQFARADRLRTGGHALPGGHFECRALVLLDQPPQVAIGERSEERRVGKECRSRWSPYH